MILRFLVAIKLSNQGLQQKTWFENFEVKIRPVEVAVLLERHADLKIIGNKKWVSAVKFKYLQTERSLRKKFRVNQRMKFAPNFHCAFDRE